MRHVLTGTGTGQGFGGSWGFKHIGTLPDLQKAIGYLSGKVNFDIVAAPSAFLSTTALRDTFAKFGAKFRGPGTSPDGGAVLNEGSNFFVSGYSARNFLAFNCGATLSNGAIPQFPERVIFSKPPLSKLPERVTLRAGSGLSVGETVTFAAQSSTGNVLDTATLNLASGLQSVDLLGPGIKTVNMKGPAAYKAVVDNVYFGGCMTQKYTDNFGTEYYLVQDGSSNISGRTHNGSVDGNPWIIRGNRSGSSLTFRVTNPSLDTGCFSYTFTGTVGAGCGTATGTWA